MKVVNLRSEFLRFFARREHQVVGSSSVMPQGDKTLMFTNAGMNQFKDVLLGNELRDYKRATSSQKCIRAGGKHNDLDEVGKDGRHLTFFEMLGNWSFGDYYKRDAISWAWEFVTQHLKFPVERVYVSTYKNDDESRRIWLEDIGLPPEKVIALGDIDKGDEENFWSMGPTGPCGPCTELYYDTRPEEGDPCWEPDLFDEDRLLEFWNLVFMEFHRDDEGKLSPLAMKSVDTGLGMERVAAILENRSNVFQTELFASILKKISGLRFSNERSIEEIYGDTKFSSFAVIADHIRSLAFTVSEGASFSNEGKGYVLRRILRRAVRHGYLLGFKESFLYKLIPTVAKNYGDVYPELKATEHETAEIIQLEEKRFFRTIENGMVMFKQTVNKLKKSGSSLFPGREAFVLHDTFGFPFDLTEIMVQELGMSADRKGFEEAMEEQVERSRAADNRYDKEQGEWISVSDKKGSFYNCSKKYPDYSCDTDIVRYRKSGDNWEFLSGSTSFYAESGGQVGDRGTFRSKNYPFSFDVIDTQKTPMGSVYTAKLKEGEVTKEAMSGSFVASVDKVKRRAIMAHHTATHLLHSALRICVSERIFQAGSLVDAKRLRFDFTFARPLNENELQEVEDLVNEHIRQAIPVDVYNDMSRSDAESIGAMAIFGEKYGEKVRVIKVGNVSAELCGGTHVSNTESIRLFRIKSETGIAAGVRRIEAVVGYAALALYTRERSLLKSLGQLLKVGTEDLDKKVQKLIRDQGDLDKRVQKLSNQLAAAEVSGLLKSIEVVEGVSILAAQIEVNTRPEMLSYIDKFRDHLGALSIVLLISVINKTPAIICMVSEQVCKQLKIKAGNLINHAASIVGGRGGGRPTLAQAGGKNCSRISEALEAFRQAAKSEVINKLG